ncbi:hypothetical protein [Mycobacterium aquaticum]|uniref:hypothetical protein n=1 Tax=Mycobacterium aquaticum TaxID=1927124 RepID=UPI003183D5CC
MHTRLQDFDHSAEDDIGYLLTGPERAAQPRNDRCDIPRQRMSRVPRRLSIGIGVVHTLHCVLEVARQERFFRLLGVEAGSLKARFRLDGFETQPAHECNDYQWQSDKYGATPTSGPRSPPRPVIIRIDGITVISTQGSSPNEYRGNACAQAGSHIRVRSNMPRQDQ